jgi:hypothetical protein
VELCGGFPVGFDATCHQDDPGTEEHGKNSDELKIGKEVAEKPDPIVCSAQVSKRGWIVVRGSDHGERLDVHQQNAKDGDSPKNID